MLKKTKVLGIIAEYNPFHLGHLWQLQTAKELLHPDVTIIILGGNYTQRGEMSFLRREDKVRIALQNGADLVVAIPFLANIQAVNVFAKEAVKIAKMVGVTHLVFGSEYPDFPYLTKAKEFLQTDIKINTPKLNFADSLAQSLNKLSIDISRPNHMLGFYYTVSAYQLNFPVCLIPLRRIKNSMSSSFLRNLWLSDDRSKVKEYLPQGEIDLLVKHPHSFFQKTFIVLKARLLLEDIEELKKTFLISLDLLNRFRQKILEAANYEELLNLVKTKRYTFTHIKRVYLYLVLRISNSIDDFNGIRVWGFNNSGRLYLQQIKKKAKILTNPKKQDYLNSDYLKFESQVNKFYDFIMDEKPSNIVITVR